MDSNSDGLLESGSKLPGFSYREGLLFYLSGAPWAFGGRIVSVPPSGLDCVIEFDPNNI